MQAPPLTCVFGVKTELKGYQKKLAKLYAGIEGLKLELLSNGLVHLQGEIDPIIFIIKKLYRARSYVTLSRIDYGYEENPVGTRKPNSHFTRGRFGLRIDISWYERIIGALKAIQGVSFTLDAQPPAQPEYYMGYAQPEYYMGYLCGNMEIGVLMKMLLKTGITLSRMEYGVEYKDAINLNPPDPKKIEAPAANETETQTVKDTEPPPSEVVNTSTKHQVIYKKPHGFFRRFSFK